VVLEQADIGVPRSLVALDVGPVLVGDELGEGRDLFGLFLGCKGVLAKRDWFRIEATFLRA